MRRGNLADDPAWSTKSQEYDSIPLGHAVAGVRWITLKHDNVAERAHYHTRTGRYLPVGC